MRKSILLILERIENGGYSHLLIDQEIKAKQFPPKDAALLTEVVYGTMQRKLTLDYYLKDFLSSNKKIQNWIRVLLRMSVYQMVFLERVPDHAIIHEAVEIAKQKGHKGVASLVNGVLRNIQRKGIPDVSDIQDDTERLCIQTSYPSWLVKSWIDSYGFDNASTICKATLKPKPSTVRIQPLRISMGRALEVLHEEGITARQSDISRQGIVIEQGNILHSRLFKEGYLTIQDPSSMLAGEMLAPKPGMKVLDTCSAPGGKVTHIAELMQNDGQIYAHDLQSNKIKAIKKKAIQLHLTIIDAKQADARKLHEIYPEASFDRILIDAPCSGFGVIRSKPDIKYRKKESDILALAEIQQEIIDQCSQLLKVGGLMVYSTCTIDKRENENIVESFLVRHNDFQVDTTFFEELPDTLKNAKGKTKFGLQLFPGDKDTEGFFLTRLIRKA